MVLILISGSAVPTASVASVTATPGRVRALQDLRLGGPPSISDSDLGLSVREQHERVGIVSAIHECCYHSYRCRWCRNVRRTRAEKMFYRVGVLDFFPATASSKSHVDTTRAKADNKISANGVSSESQIVNKPSWVVILPTPSSFSTYTI